MIRSVDIGLDCEPIPDAVKRLAGFSDAVVIPARADSPYQWGIRVDLPPGSSPNLNRVVERISKLLRLPPMTRFGWTPMHGTVAELRNEPESKQ